MGYFFMFAKLNFVRLAFHIERIERGGFDTASPTQLTSTYVLQDASSFFQSSMRHANSTQRRH
jgi:hypothetical protein